MPLPVSPAYLGASCTDGFKAGDTTLVHKHLSDLRLTTGRLVACDPFVCLDAEPFSLELPRGHFPLVLSVAHIANDQRIALASIRFKQSDPVTWSMMTVGGQDTATLQEGHIFGYPVDSGTGCFMDRSAHLALVKTMRDNPNFFQTMIAEMDKTYVHTWSWLDMEFGGSNLLAFSSGDGDGVYATYAGYDSQGQLSAIVTDFAMFDL